jgi:Ca2+-transporting ATPase
MMHSDDSAPPFQRPAAEVLARLGTDPSRGLDSAEVRRRQQACGPNLLEAREPVPGWRKFLAQFTDVLVLLLLVAAAVSAAIWWMEREAALPYEALAILAVVLLNAVMGYVQQARAERAVAALRDMSAARARVLRDGQRQDIPASELVPGDILLLEEGDTVPADGRLLQATALHTAEAALTGESLPVGKDTAPIEGAPALGDQHNMVFSGTAVTSGRGRAVVTAIGMDTQMGRIAGLLHETPEETTPLHREINRVGRMLGVVVVAIAVVMIATILLVQDIRGLAAFFEVLIFGVALAVAAVPEGLPAVVTAVLALGVQRMAKRRAIVRHLAAVETLGSATVIASDKTGTLTRNEMTVRTLVTASGRVHFGGTGYAPEGEVHSGDGGGIEGPLREEFLRALAAGDRANNAVLQERDGRWSVQGDPTEAALIVAARKAGFTDEVLGGRFRRVAEVPFSSERKLMSTVHQDARREEVLVAFTKGAPDVLLARCTHEQVGAEHRPLTAERRARIQQANDTLAGEGLRTLGLALRLLPRDVFQRDPDADGHLEEQMVFLGLVGMLDPPRAEAAEAVARARHAGIRPLMITGDHPVTARVIAAELGIAQDGRVATGPELEKASDTELEAIVRDTSVYARVNPTHKLRIVRALQAQGHIVAMTGDGVNDAPALKSAEIGVAMGITGTDVSKEAADIVLADDNFATIVAAVEEGRSILSNIRKFLRYLLSSNIGEVMTMFLGVLLAGVIGLPDDGGLVLPLLATQILWINLVTDGAPALALGVDPPEPGMMNRPPRARGERIITRPMWRGIFLVGAIMAAGTLLVLDASLPGGLIEGHHDIHYAQTMAFLTLVLFNVLNVFNARSDEASAFTGLFSNAWLWGSVLLALALQLAVVYVPVLQAAFSTTALGFTDWLLCAAVASSVVWLRELDKLIHRLRHRGTPRKAPAAG